jgi:hypothetical protein
MQTSEEVRPSTRIGTGLSIGNLLHGTPERRLGTSDRSTCISPAVKLSKSASIQCVHN